MVKQLWWWRSRFVVDLGERGVVVGSWEGVGRAGGGWRGKERGEDKED